ncbi:MAG: hypothetical protein ACJ8HJ_07985 [Massilia sp.]
MRPTDENQPGSRRPNLMSSSRRATGEINILAMLDGQAPGRRLRALPAVAWYGAAGVLACSLLAALGWLVRGATPARDADTAGATQASAQPTSPTQSTRSVRPTRGSGDAGTVSDARGSIPVDVPSLRATLAAESPVSVTAPDMVAAPAATGPARGAVIIDLPQPAATTTPAPALAATSRHPVTHPTTPAVPSARPQPAFRPMPAQALAHADPAAPRQKRAGGASRTTSPNAVDTDVALISAILQHTGTRNEAADGAGTAACTDKSCNPRLPSRQ